jgi:hypothetical protein
VREPYSWNPSTDGETGAQGGDGGTIEADARTMAHANSFVRSAGEKAKEVLAQIGPKLPQTQGEAEIVSATAARLTGGKRWSVRRPKK